MITTSTPSKSKWSDENILDLIRKLRNDLIKDFLDERLLIQYLQTQFRVYDLSRDRIDSMRDDLKELLIRPINRVHYQVIIDEIRETDSASLSKRNEQLFYKEIEAILKQHIF